MDRTPPPRRRHPAARSRVVAGALSAVLFCGLGVGMAANQTTTVSAASSSSGTASAQEDTGSGSSWAATPGSSSDQSAMTSSQGS